MKRMGVLRGRMPHLRRLPIDLGVRRLGAHTSLLQHYGLFRRAEGDDLRLALVTLDKGDEEPFIACIAFLLRLLRKGADVFGAVQLGHGKGVEVAVGLVELDKTVVEGDAFFKGFVGGAVVYKN